MKAACHGSPTLCRVVLLYTSVRPTLDAILPFVSIVYLLHAFFRLFPLSMVFKIIFCLFMWLKCFVCLRFISVYHFNASISKISEVDCFCFHEVQKSYPDKRTIYKMYVSSMHTSGSSRLLPAIGERRVSTYAILCERRVEYLMLFSVNKERSTYAVFLGQ